MDLLFGHASVMGNERADGISSKALITGMVSMGRSEILRKIRYNFIKSEITICGNDSGKTVGVGE